MLILSRKIDESIVINDNISIKVISIDKGIVKLGIEAPSDINILRSELIEAVEASNKSANISVDDALLHSITSKLKK